MTTAVPTAITPDQFDSIVARIRDEMYPEDISDTDDAVDNGSGRAPGHVLDEYHRLLADGTSATVLGMQSDFDFHGVRVRKSLNSADDDGIRAIDAARDVYLSGNLRDTVGVIKHAFACDYSAYEQSVLRGISKVLHKGFDKDTVFSSIHGKFSEFKSAVKSIYGNFNSTSVCKYVTSKIEENS